MWRDRKAVCHTQGKLSTEHFLPPIHRQLCWHISRFLLWGWNVSQNACHSSALAVYGLNFQLYTVRAMWQQKVSTLLIISWTEDIKPPVLFGSAWLGIGTLYIVHWMCKAITETDAEWLHGNPKESCAQWIKKSHIKMRKYRSQRCNKITGNQFIIQFFILLFCCCCRIVLSRP